MIGLILAAALASAAPDCSYDKAAMLALPPDKFDQDLKGGWRPLAEKPECRPQAADLIAAYRKAHWGRLESGDLHESYWHEGQIRAAAGQTGDAVRLLLAGVDPDSLDDAEDYAIGTVAFLNHDRAALEAARSRTAALPQPDWFAHARAEAARTGRRPPTWPPHLVELDMFLRCFDKPYAEAYYGPACAPAPKP